MNLYIAAAFTEPTNKEAEEGGKGEIVLNPTCFLASSEDSARTQAVRKIGEDVDVDRLVVRVKPF